jgi:uncharacterized protein (DUF1697 family)
MCEAAGFEDVRTYIASGNVVFSSKLAEKAVKRALEQRLQDYAGKPVGVMVRSAAEMAAVLAPILLPRRRAIARWRFSWTRLHRRRPCTMSPVRRVSSLRWGDAKSTCITAMAWPTRA